MSISIEKITDQLAQNDIEEVSNEDNFISEIQNKLMNNIDLLSDRRKKIVQKEQDFIKSVEQLNTLNSLHKEKDESSNKEIMTIKKNIQKICFEMLQLEKEINEISLDLRNNALDISNQDVSKSISTLAIMDEQMFDDSYSLSKEIVICEQRRLRTAAEFKGSDKVEKAIRQAEMSRTSHQFYSEIEGYSKDKIVINLYNTLKNNGIEKKIEDLYTKVSKIFQEDILNIYSDKKSKNFLLNIIKYSDLNREELKELKENVKEVFDLYGFLNKKKDIKNNISIYSNKSIINLINAISQYSQCKLFDNSKETIKQLERELLSFSEELSNKKSKLEILEKEQKSISRKINNSDLLEQMVKDLEVDITENQSLLDSESEPENKLNIKSIQDAIDFKKSQVENWKKNIINSKDEEKELVLLRDKGSKTTIKIGVIEYRMQLLTDKVQNIKQELNLLLIPVEKFERMQKIIEAIVYVKPTLEKIKTMINNSLVLTKRDLVTKNDFFKFADIDLLSEETQRLDEYIKLLSKDEKTCIGKNERNTVAEKVMVLYEYIQNMKVLIPDTKISYALNILEKKLKSLKEVIVAKDLEDENLEKEVHKLKSELNLKSNNTKEIIQIKTNHMKKLQEEQEDLIKKQQEKMDTSELESKEGATKIEKEEDQEKLQNTDDLHKLIQDNQKLLDVLQSDLDKLECLNTKLPLLLDNRLKIREQDKHAKLELELKNLKDKYDNELSKLESKKNKLLQKINSATTGILQDPEKEVLTKVGEALLEIEKASAEEQDLKNKYENNLIRTKELFATEQREIDLKNHNILLLPIQNYCSEILESISENRFLENCEGYRREQLEKYNNTKINLMEEQEKLAISKQKLDSNEKMSVKIINEDKLKELKCSSKIGGGQKKYLESIKSNHDNYKNINDINTQIEKRLQKIKSDLHKYEQVQQIYKVYLKDNKEPLFVWYHLPRAERKAMENWLKILSISIKTYSGLSNSSKIKIEGLEDILFDLQSFNNGYEYSYQSWMHNEINMQNKKKNIIDVMKNVEKLHSKYSSNVNLDKRLISLTKQQIKYIESELGFSNKLIDKKIYLQNIVQYEDDVYDLEKRLNGEISNENNEMLDKFIVEKTKLDTLLGIAELHDSINSFVRTLEVFKKNMSKLDNSYEIKYHENLQSCCSMVYNAVGGYSVDNIKFQISGVADLAELFKRGNGFDVFLGIWSENISNFFECLYAEKNCDLKNMGQSLIESARNKFASYSNEIIQEWLELSEIYKKCNSGLEVCKEHMTWLSSSWYNFENTLFLNQYLKGNKVLLENTAKQLEDLMLHASLCVINNHTLRFSAVKKNILQPQNSVVNKRANNLYLWSRHCLDVDDSYIRHLYDKTSRACYVRDMISGLESIHDEDERLRKIYAHDSELDKAKFNDNLSSNVALLKSEIESKMSVGFLDAKKNGSCFTMKTLEF